MDGERERFDALVVANGHHWDPRYPDFPGSFDGETIHSHHYIDPTRRSTLRGKRIVVVGIGNSAADIVSELSQKAYDNRVFISTRSGAWVVPKYVFGRPADRIGRTLPYVPLAWQRRMIRWLPKVISGDPEDYGLPDAEPPFPRGAPDDLERAADAPRLGRREGQAERRRAARRPRALRGRHASRRPT